MKAAIDSTSQRCVYRGIVMSAATWQHWEIRRYLLQTETPGRFGYFDALEGAPLATI